MAKNNNDMKLTSIYDGDIFKDLPLTMQFLKSMTPETESDIPKEKKEKSIKAIESTLYKTKMFVCYEFYRPISKLIHPQKNESEINK
ncbi:MAG: hypothetical protein IPJ81_01930 [Chitinophagaceae bacterium]|nr:hypothetical protein [Chitinophagaceae bacterium]